MSCFVDNSSLNVLGESDIIVLLEIDLPAELKKESGSEEDNTEVVSEGESRSISSTSC